MVQSILEVHFVASCLLFELFQINHAFRFKDLQSPKITSFDSDVYSIFMTVALDLGSIEPLGFDKGF